MITIMKLTIMVMMTIITNSSDPVLLQPGVPMEIALNKESKRKTPTAVAIRDDERSFGSDALVVGVKHPKDCYFYFTELLGKPFDHPSVDNFRRRFPHYSLEEDPVRKTVLFRHDANTTFSPEELTAMVLSHAKQIADAHTEQAVKGGSGGVKDAVIVVPAYLNQAERRALLVAGDLAGLNVLQLVSEPMAVALNYGMFRRKEIDSKPKYLMFYDMGAADTTVSVVRFQTVSTKERGYTETHPEAQVLGVG